MLNMNVLFALITISLMCGISTSQLVLHFFFPNKAAFLFGGLCKFTSRLMVMRSFISRSAPVLFLLLISQMPVLFSTVFSLVGHFSAFQAFMEAFQIFYITVKAKTS